DRGGAAVPGAGRLVVVGPERPGLDRAVFRTEDPPGGGPVPALRAGLAEVSAPRVVLLAADLPFLRAEHVAALLAAEGPGAVLVDDGGHEQWLVGAWRTAVLAEALARYEGRSLRGLLAPLRPAALRLPGEPWFDCDTLDDLEHVRSKA
ncbi:molybdenum cofactor guanylyltransferase, partial [Planomonospora corallina]